MGVGVGWGGVGGGGAVLSLLGIAQLTSRLTQLPIFSFLFVILFYGVCVCCCCCCFLAPVLAVPGVPQLIDLVIRKDILHLRGPGYLPAATKDLAAFFGSFGVAFVEWLNGVSLNVHFADVHSAERALQSLSLPIPVVEGVKPVNPMWRIGTQPLVKVGSCRECVCVCMCMCLVSFPAAS